MTIDRNTNLNQNVFYSIMSIVFSAITLSACANNSVIPAVSDTVCTSAVAARRTPLPLATNAQRERLLAEGFSAEAVHIADVIGAAGSLLASAETPRRRNGSQVVDSFGKDHVTLSLNRGILEVQGTVASLACQASRIAELQDGLTHQQAAISHRYSVAGLAFTAGSAIAGGVAGFIANSTIANVTSISGGGLETLVVMLELDVAPAGTLRLQQNILEEFWRAPETPTFFPQRVWRYLNTSVIPGGQTPRESIIASWRQDHLIPDEDFTPEPPPIILKRDSVKSDELDIMRQLIATLEARVGLMSRSMGRLVEELLERSEAASLNRLDARPQIRLSVLDPSTPGPDNSSRPTVARQATRVSQPPHEPPTGLASRPLRQTTVTGSLQAGISQPDAPAALDTAGRSAIDLEQRDGSMVLQAMNSWLDAWRARDVDLYLSFYSDSFLPRNVQDLAEWRQRRQATIASSGTIALSVRDTRMQFTGTDQALINFHQTYRANGIELRTNKRLVWRRENSGWRIISEDVVGERRGR